MILFLFSFLFAILSGISIDKQIRRTRKLLSDGERAEAVKQIFTMVKEEIAKFTDFVPKEEVEAIAEGESATYLLKGPDETTFPAFTITNKSKPNEDESTDSPCELHFEKKGGTAVVKKLSVSLLSSYENMEIVNNFIKRSVENFMMKMLQIPKNFNNIVDETVNMIKFVFTKESSEGITDFISSLEEQEDKKTETDRLFTLKLMSSEFDRIDMLIKH